MEVFIKKEAGDLNVRLLKDCPETIPLLAKWAFQEWGRYDKTLTEEKLVSALKARLYNDRIPFTLVAFKDNYPVGTIALKEEGAAELADLHDGNPWLGSFFVVPEERKHNLGSQLFTLVLKIAKNLGHTHVWLYTSNRENVPWYVKRGGTVIETRPFRQHEITVIQISLKDRNHG